MSPTREQAWRTLNAYANSDSLVRHALAREAATAFYAARFGEDEELWRVAALVYDLGRTTLPAIEDGPGDEASILRREGYPEGVIGAVSRSTHSALLLARTLVACDHLSAFISACGVIRPTGLDGLEPRWVRRRLKQPAFAPGVSRDAVAHGAELLGLDADEHIANVIAALRPIARELGLRTAADDAAVEPASSGPKPAAAGPPMVSNLWYAQYFDLEQLQAKRIRLGLAFLRAALRGDLIITILTRWSIPAAILSTFLRRPRVVLLELQHIPVSGWRAMALRLARPLVGRGIAAAQVLSSWEVEACHRFLGVPSDRIRFIPWPLHHVDPGPRTRAGYVLASGRAACDWETLFRAADDAEWPLVVVCGQVDAEEVARLNAGERARVFVDIPRDQHHRLLKEASVYVLPLSERHHSAGHIRILDAASTMTPVVTTDIRGLVDYVVPLESALVVEPGDPVALREAIERVLEDESLRRRLTEHALQVFGTRSLEDYETQIQDLVYTAAESS